MAKIVFGCSKCGSSKIDGEYSNPKCSCGSWFYKTRLDPNVWDTLNYSEQCAQMAELFKIDTEETKRKVEEQQRREEEQQRREEEQQRREEKLRQEQDEVTSNNMPSLLQSEAEKTALNDIYQYEVVTIRDTKTGSADINAIQETLNKYSLLGWRLIAVNTNEIGVNSSSYGVGGFSSSTNATIDQTLLYFERCIKRRS